MFLSYRLVYCSSVRWSMLRCFVPAWFAALEAVRNMGWIANGYESDAGSDWELSLEKVCQHLPVPLFPPPLVLIHSVSKKNVYGHPKISMAHISIYFHVPTYIQPPTIQRPWNQRHVVEPQPQVEDLRKQRSETRAPGAWQPKPASRPGSGSQSSRVTVMPGISRAEL